MGFRNREIEVKLEVMSKDSLADLRRDIYRAYHDDCSQIINGYSKDVYFGTPGLKGDFARVRYGRKGELSQLTVKYTDKNLNDRVEIDVPTNNPKAAEAFCRQLFGPPDGEIKKKYHVYFLNSHSNIAIYQIKNDPRVFVEIEATTRKRVDNILNVFQKKFPDLKLKQSTKSLYQLFVVPAA